MNADILHEDLLEELARLVGRPRGLVQDMLARVLETVESTLEPELLGQLATFPMTSWPALTPAGAQTGAVWQAAVSTGLTTEEALTALAVLDDHVRRRYGSDSWARVQDWGPRMACRYNLATAAPGTAPSESTFPSA